MERLTERNLYCEKIDEVYRKLKEYEDAETKLKEIKLETKEKLEEM